MTLREELLYEFVAAYPAQPATAYWRGIEIAMAAHAGLPKGLGLDLGCGDGILTSILLKYTGPRTLVGIDIDPEETSAAARFDFYERIHTCTAHHIPEKDAAFDFVISNSVLEHIPDLEAVIAEVGRLLRPGGEFIFTVPCPSFRENLKGSFLGLRPREDYLRDLDARLVHLNYLDERQWHELCARHGLTIDTCTGYMNPAETRRWETLSRMTGGLLYWLTGGRRRPIEIQRRLGLRHLQNRSGFPRAIARMIGRFIAFGVSAKCEGPSSCILIRGRRQAPPPRS